MEIQTVRLVYLSIAADMFEFETIHNRIMSEMGRIGKNPEWSHFSCIVSSASGFVSYYFYMHCSIFFL